MIMTQQPEQNERGIGDNMPPIEYNNMEYLNHVDAVNAIVDDAHAILTGVPVENEKQYIIVKDLQDSLKKIRLAAEKQRKIDKQPYLDGSSQIESNYKALNVKVTTAESAARECVQPYLQKLEEERIEAQKQAQEEKEKAERELAEAHESKQGADLEESERINELADELKEKEKQANKTKRPIATGMKTVFTPTITDKVEVIKHYWTDPSLVETLMKLINADIRSGKREIPGVEIKEERVAR
jgi:hypothetical protein